MADMPLPHAPDSTETLALYALRRTRHRTTGWTARMRHTPMGHVATIKTLAGHAWHDPRCAGKPEPVVVVPVIRIIVVAIGHPDIPVIVVPGAPAQHTVRFRPPSLDTKIP